MILALLFLMAGAASAAQVDVYLRAGASSLTLPDGAGGTRDIPVWGFALDSGFGAGDGAITLPGPVLRAREGDTLRIHLDNDLSEPVSLHIIGQKLTNNAGPVWSSPNNTSVTGTGSRGAGDFTSRVRSFSHETGPGNSTQVDYVFDGLKAGTYIYQSASNPAKQVQMGLFGVLVVQAASTPADSNVAYTGMGYDRELILVFHDIDWELNDAIRAGTYGAVAGATFTSSIYRHPTYFLINGKVWPDAGLDPVNTEPVDPAGERVLLRFVNAGLNTYVPQLLGASIRAVAEDGMRYLYAKETYGIELPSGKTVDAFLQSASRQRVPVYDARLNLTNANQSPGGMLAFISTGTTAATPVAYPDSYTTAEDTQLIGTSVLANDTPATGLTAQLVSGTTNGALNLAADGTFTYAPNANFNGSDSFSYRACSGATCSIATVASITVTSVNDIPTATPDSYSVQAGSTLNITAPGVLANDTDVDGDTLTVSTTPVTAPTKGSLALNADGSFTYTPTVAGPDSDSFVYSINDGNGGTAQATVTITITAAGANQPPVAVNDRATTSLNTPVTIHVIANDYDPDGTIDPASITITTSPNRGGTAIPDSDGTVVFTPQNNYQGVDTFYYTVRDNGGAVSGPARVQVQIKRGR
jgi:FtsP/CotA-like multicopper oxidase with cupredoxin domain